MRELLSAVKETAATAATQLRTHAIVGVLKEAEGFALEYEAHRRRAGVADFDDILLWARQMLRQSKEARDYFRMRFPVLMVDEFQDTDPVQAEIILTIASDDEPGDDEAAQGLEEQETPADDVQQDEVDEEDPNLSDHAEG